MSIIDKKYVDRYKDREKDWLSKFIDDNVTSPVTKEKTTKAEDGTETTEVVTLKKTTLNLNNLFALAKANHVDTATYEEQADRKNAAGRLRMTIGNILRSAALKRHGLFDIHGEWHAAAPEFLGDHEQTENSDGTKIPKVKAEASEDAPAAA